MLGTFNGGDDSDLVLYMYDGTFNGGGGTDSVENYYDGTLISVP
jgi:hypothetical protein